MSKDVKSSLLELAPSLDAYTFGTVLISRLFSKRLAARD